MLLTRDSAFAQSESRTSLAALKHFRKVRLVQPIVIANATATKRNELAFTKIHMVTVNTKRIIFLDLDISSGDFGVFGVFPFGAQEICQKSVKNSQQHIEFSPNRVF